ncbi:MAG: PEP-CTERM sorting domain-containing protein [Nostoc sp.]|uniref:PEP-CTERM sorting domain-containing protein n=1 Tax=Nostoc sp. TaxID=1180 RepID=UPI002FF9D35A
MAFSIENNRYYQPPAPQPKKVPEPSTTAVLGLFALGVFGLQKKNKKYFPFYIT